MRAVVLVLDGVRIEESLGDGYSDVLGEPTTALYPVMRSELLPRGALMSGAIAAGMTRTAPGHADLLAGRRTAFANYPNDTETPGAYLPELPTLIDAIAPAPALVVTNSPLVSPIYRSVSSQGGAAATLISAQGDNNVVEALRAQMAGADYRLVVANLHKADAVAHAGRLEEYSARSQSYDTLVADFWQWIQAEPGWQDRTVLAVIADHGRHRLGTDDDWTNHGDHCVGCRQIPMLLVGPGIQPGVRVQQTVTLEDLGATLAQLLGVTLPYAAGQPIADALATPAVPAAAGTVRIAADGGVLATEDSLDGRSTISLDGVTVSAPAAFTAEAPRVATAGDTVYACWRELDLTDTDIEGRWPWRARCLADGVPIDPGLDPVWSEWEPALSADEGGLWMAWADNLTGVAMLPSPVRLSRWTEADGWDHSTVIEAGAFPDGVAAAVDEAGTWIVLADSDDDPEGRLGRRISVHRVRDSGPRRLLRIRPDDLETSDDIAADGDRLEHPALWVDGEALRLAWIAYRADATSVGASLWRVDSPDRGRTWSEPQEVAPDVLGHVAPVWTGDGVLAWIQPDGALCRETDSRCTDLGTTVVLDLTADGEALHVSAQQDGAWVHLTR